MNSTNAVNLGHSVNSSKNENPNKTSKSSVNMLEGSLLDKILLFAIPLALSSMIQQLFNTADTAVVGRFASSQDMAAVGANASVISLIVSLFIGLSVGANVAISRLIGLNKTKKIIQQNQIFLLFQTLNSNL